MHSSTRNSISRTRVRFQPCQEGVNTAGGRRDTRIRGSVIELDVISICVNRLSCCDRSIRQ